MADTGWLSGGTYSATFDTGNSPTIDCQNPGNGSADDSFYVTWPFTASGQVGYGLRASNFDFSSIPANATIDGIEVRLKDYFSQSASSGCSWDQVRLIGTTGTVIGANKGADLPTINFIDTGIAGGPDDLWDLFPIARSDLDDIDFGCVVSPDSGASSPGNVSLDVLQMRVYYHVGLPSTINVETGNLGHNPPFKSSGGNFYVIRRQNNRDISAYKATDPTDSWTEVDSAGRFVVGSGGIQCISTAQEGDTIHVAVIGNQSGYICAYMTFDMATDTWMAGGPSGYETFAATIDSAALPGYLVWSSIAVRSDGDVIVVYSGDSDRVMGGDKQRVDYSRREGGTWTRDQALDAAGDIHYGNPSVVLGVNNDEMHIVWQVQTSTVDPPTAWSGKQWRTLDSAFNTLSTTFGNNLIGDIQFLVGQQNLIAYNDGTDDVIATISDRTVTNGHYTRFTKFEETVDGDLDSVPTSTDDILDEVGTGLELARLPISLTDYTVWSIAVEPATDNIWLIFANDADLDVYYVSSTDGGATWSAATEHLNAVTCNHISADIYVRGSDTVLAYHYDDNGTGKYNEVVVVAGAGNISQLPSIEFTVTNHAPSAVTTEKNISELPSAGSSPQPTFIGSVGNYDNSGTATNLDVDVSALTLLEDDVLIAFVHVNNNQTITSTGGNFTSVFQEENPTSSTSRYGFFSRVCTDSEPSTFNFDLGGLGQRVTIYILQFRDVDTSNIFDVLPSATSRSNDDSVSTLSSPVSLTTTAEKTIGLGVFGNDGTLNVFGSYTNGYADEVEHAGGLCDQALSVVSKEYSTSGNKGTVNATMSPSTPDDITGYHIALKGKFTSGLVITGYPPDAVTAPPVSNDNISQLPSDTLTLDDFDPSAVTTEKNRSNLPSDTLTLTAYAPNAIASDNNQSALPSDTLTLGGFDPSAVTTEKNVALLATAAMALTAFAPQAVATENNFSQLPSQTITIADNDPTIEVTEHQISELGTQNLVLTTYDPTIIVADPDTSELPSDTLTLTTYPPQAVTTEKHISELPSQALALTGFAPGTETFDPNTSQLPSDTLTLTGYDPSAVTTEGADSDVSQLPSQALVLNEFDPQAVTTEKHISELPSQALSLAGFAPSTETFDPNISQLSSDALTLTGFDPQAVTTEGDQSNTSQLPSQALTLDEFDPQTVTTEKNVSELPSQALTLTKYAPTAETFDPNTSQLPSQALTLTGYGPSAVTTEQNTSELPSQALTLTKFAPQFVTTEANISELPSAALTLTGYVPQAVTTVTSDNNTSELPVASLAINLILPGGTAGVLPSILDLSYDSVSSPGDLVAECMGFDISTDGTKLFASTEDHFVHSWDLSPAFDITSASNHTVSAAISSGTNYPRDIQWSSDGLTLYALLYAVGTINKQAVSTPYNLADLGSVWDQSNDLGANHRAFHLSTDGTRLAVNISENFQIGYSMSPAYDLSTLSQIGSLGNFGPKGDIVVADDGLRAWMLPRDTSVVEQYTLSTAWDFSTASADGDTLTLNSSENNSLSLVFRGDRGELYAGFYGDSSVNDCIIEKYTYSDTSYAPTIVVSENNLSFIFISRELTLTGYAPQAVTTEKNISELPGQSLTLTAHAPLVINREQRQRLFIIT